MTNEQLKNILNAELGMTPISFSQVLCAVEVLCAKWRVPFQQANEVIPLVLATRFAEDELFIKRV